MGSHQTLAGALCLKILFEISIWTWNVPHQCSVFFAGIISLLKNNLIIGGKKNSWEQANWKIFTESRVKLINDLQISDKLRHRNHGFLRIFHWDFVKIVHKIESMHQTLYTWFSKESRCWICYSSISREACVEIASFIMLLQAPLCVAFIIKQLLTLPSQT
jgi:hypothetical protein